MDSMKRAPLLVLVCAPLLAHCMPDFDALSAGLGSSAGTSSGGDAMAGDGPASGSSSSSGGASSKAGSPNGGMTSGGTTGGDAPTSGTTGSGGQAPEGGAFGDTDDGGAGLGGTPAGGEGGDSGCEPPASGNPIYATFDEGLNDSSGFVGASANTNMHTTLGATGSSAWDSEAGSGCPGSLLFSFNFEDYASGASADEKGYGNYVFAPMDWSSSAALHVMIKVSPADAPIASLQLFVLSGTEYLFWGEFDDGDHKTGEWYEMVLRPVAGTFYDPTDVYRIGVEVVLARAGTAGNPAEPPPMKLWLDDLWLERK
jgi:hypothetical protein